MFILTCRLLWSHRKASYGRILHDLLAESLSNHVSFLNSSSNRRHYGSPFLLSSTRWRVLVQREQLSHSWWACSAINCLCNIILPRGWIWERCENIWPLVILTQVKSAEQKKKHSFIAKSESLEQPDFHWCRDYIDKKLLFTHTRSATCIRCLLTFCTVERTTVCPALCVKPIRLCQIWTERHNSHKREVTTFNIFTSVPKPLHVHLSQSR